MRRGSLRGRRGTWRHGRAFCVAGVARGDMDVHFAWQAWHSWHWAGCPHTTCSHTTCSHTQLTHTQRVTTLCVAGVALGDMDVHSAWQAWHLMTWRAWFPYATRLFAWQAWHLARQWMDVDGQNIQTPSIRHKPLAPKTQY